MLSSVLKSPRAVQVNIQIMRTFVRLRQMLASNETLIERLDELEENYDAKFKIVFRAIHSGDPTLPRYGTDPVQQRLLRQSRDWLIDRLCLDHFVRPRSNTMPGG
jgi:hypothetical protein